MYDNNTCFFLLYCLTSKYKDTFLYSVIQTFKNILWQYICKCINSDCVGVSEDNYTHSLSLLSTLYYYNIVVVLLLLSRFAVHIKIRCEIYRQSVCVSLPVTLPLPLQLLIPLQCYNSWGLNSAQSPADIGICLSDCLFSLLFSVFTSSMSENKLFIRGNVH